MEDLRGLRMRCSWPGAALEGSGQRDTQRGHLPSHGGSLPRSVASKHKEEIVYNLSVVIIMLYVG